MQYAIDRLYCVEIAIRQIIQPGMVYGIIKRVSGMEELYNRLVAFPGSYFGFVMGVITYAKTKPERVNKIMDYLKSSDNLDTSDVIEFISDQPDFHEFCANNRKAVEEMDKNLKNGNINMESSQKGWTKELNLISWNGKRAKYDIREWSPNHEKMGKGITLSGDEVLTLLEALKKVEPYAREGIIYDPDCPPMTDEQLKKFKPAGYYRNYHQKTVFIKSSGKTGTVIDVTRDNKVYTIELDPPDSGTSEVTRDEFELSDERVPKVKEVENGETD